VEEELDQPLSLERMAEFCAQTPLAFLRGFTASFGQTPHAYVTARRIAAARRLLSETDMPLAMVAYECGFSHQSHLGCALRAAIGLTPAAYRRAFKVQNRYMPPTKITPENKSAVTQ
jgi:AraC family transcriptional regulator